jgi:beta-lactam-binding protein with PASTA domain
MRVVALVVALLLGFTACSGGKKAAPLVRVPDLRGLPTQEALERLAAAKLCVSHVDREPGRGSGPERIVDQRPRARSRVRVLGRVSLRTTAFPPDVEIVDVVAAADCPPLALPLGPPQR